MKFEQIARQARKLLEWNRKMRTSSFSYHFTDADYQREEQHLLAVIEGRLITVQDDRWSRQAAYPVVGEFEIDGWKFTLRGHDPHFERCNPEEDWITASLVEFRRGEIHYNHEGRCIDCDEGVGAGSVEMFTPSGRRFYAYFRDECSCGISSGARKVRLIYRLGEALKVLLGYLPGTESHQSELQAAALSWYKHETGSMGRLKAAVRALGVGIDLKAD
ncbi:MAG: hypothetical protein HY459_01805 [Parcubacteria group bacterium]|nr:hypothetical protein [Parcubacteria group bacterium]